MAEPRAVRFTGAGGVDVIDVVPLPAMLAREPGPGEIALDVAASALNRADVLQRRGLYPAPAGAPADIPGLELAGVVSAIGPDVSEWAVGDRVMGIVAGGGMATRAVVRARELVAVPAGLELESAAAIPEAFFTAYDALVLQARLGVGERALIHAVASGVGTAAIQIASRVGADVYGTSRTASKLEGLERLGLEHPIVATGDRFADQVAKASGGRGVDVVLDTVGGSYFADNLAAMAPCGRMVVIGLLGGFGVGKAGAPLATILSKRLTIRGSVLRGRAPEEKATLAAAVGRTLVPMFERGELEPVIDTVMPMTEVRAAHERMDANATSGKIVLAW